MKSVSLGEQSQASRAALSHFIPFFQQHKARVVQQRGIQRPPVPKNLTPTSHRFHFSQFTQGSNIGKPPMPLMAPKPFTVNRKSLVERDGSFGWEPRFWPHTESFQMYTKPHPKCPSERFPALRAVNIVYCDLNESS